MAMEIMRRLTRGIGFNKFASVVRRSWLYEIAMWIMAFLLIPDLNDLKEFLRMVGQSKGIQ